MRAVSIKLKPKNVLCMCKRFETTIRTKKLVFSEHGDPMKVLYRETDFITEPKEDEALIKMLAAPVNPVDINIIQGKYPTKLSLPAVAGTEGVAEVIKIGSKVKDIKVGDHVVPVDDTLGLWRTYVCLPEDQLLQIPKTLGLVEAATLSINPCSAFRMLKDYVNLKPGDTVIQNGANSAVGQTVIQMCHAWGINTVNIVRERPNLRDLKDYLISLGATHVLTEDDLRTTHIFNTEKLPKPRLALDCVGGKSATEILRQLQNGQPMVTYGGMSLKPIQVPVSALIFRGINVYGFRIANWTAKNKKNNDWYRMFNKIISMIMKGELKGPKHQMIYFGNYKEAITNTLTAQGMVGKKYVLIFDQ